MKSSSSYKVVNPINTMIFVYILKLDRGKYYTGITKNLITRIVQHIKSKSGFTSNYSIASLVYLTTAKDYKEARKLEVYIKSIGAVKYMNQVKFNDRYFLEIPIPKLMDYGIDKDVLEQLKMIQNLRTQF